MIEKHSDLSNEGREIVVVAGDLKGKQGVVKTASMGILVVRLPNGDEIEVDETAAKFVEKPR